jgi:Spy/CpxP family protein refolding chaperone
MLMLKPTTPPWRNPRIVLTLTLIFLVGFLTGALSMRLEVKRAVQRQESFAEVARKEIALEKLTKDLDLTPEQRKHLDMVLDDFVKYVQMLQVQMDEVRADGKDRIMGILNPQQKKKFEKMLGELQARRNQQ